MDETGDLTPTTPSEGALPPSDSGGVPPAPTSRWSRYRRFVIPGGAVAVLAAAIAATLLLLLKPATTVEKMVPATANIMVIATVDPSATQKINLMRALHAFPILGSDQAITSKLDQALKDTGLTYSGDIRPWLGAEIGVSGAISMAQAADTPFSLYLTSRDDAKAQAALTKFRNGKAGRQLTWQDQAYAGVTISVGTPGTKNAKAGAYAYVDHVVVIASSVAMIHDIIDADQGHAARLVDSASYKATVASLPTDRVAILYVDGKSLVASVKQQLSTMSSVSTGSMASLSDLEAFVGVGAAVYANSNGVLADMVIKVDQSKLSAATRAAMSNPGHPDIVLHWIPQGSDAFFAFGNLNQSLTSLLNQAGSSAAMLSAVTDGIGLTGPAGVLPNLTGDAGIELEVGTRAIPSGAVLIGTDNPARMSAFFKKLLEAVGAFGGDGSIGSGGSLVPVPGLTPSASASGTSSAVPATTPSVVLSPQPAFKTLRYRGILITYDSALLGSASPAFQPAYAVADGMGILASNVAEVKAVIDAHLGGSEIGSDPTYKTALRGALKQPSGILYVNVGSLVDAVQRFSTGSGLSSVDTQAIANLRPIKTLILTATNQANAMIERLFVVIQ